MEGLFNPHWVCPYCGEISPTEFMHHLNHSSDPDGVCVTAWLKANHARHTKHLPDLSTRQGSIK